MQLQWLKDVGKLDHPGLGSQSKEELGFFFYFLPTRRHFYLLPEFQLLNLLAQVSLSARRQGHLSSSCSSKAIN